MTRPKWPVSFACGSLLAHDNPRWWRRSYEQDRVIPSLCRIARTLSRTSIYSFGIFHKWHFQPQTAIFIINLATKGFRIGVVGHDNKVGYYPARTFMSTICVKFFSQGGSSHRLSENPKYLQQVKDYLRCALCGPWNSLNPRKASENISALHGRRTKQSISPYLDKSHSGFLRYYIAGEFIAWRFGQHNDQLCVLITVLVRSSNDSFLIVPLVFDPLHNTLYATSTKP